MGHNQRTGALEPLDFNHLVDNVPEFKLIPTEVDTYQFDPPIDSSDMSPVRWKQLVKVISDRYEEYDGFVVLHGTDTMSYTASALSFMFENLTKPIILTGSQLPIGQLRTDGKENLMTSLELASAHHLMARQWYQRFVSTLAVISYEATAQRSRMQTSLMRLTLLIILISARLVSTSTLMNTIS